MDRNEQRARKELLEYKKGKFLQDVGASAEYLGHKSPKVKFWGVKDPNHFNKSERAHIHLEKNLICIPETELEIMEDDEIKETAAHEVAHLFEVEHGTRHSNLTDNTKASLWKPELGEGVRLVTEENRKIKLKGKKVKLDKSRCFYHVCNKKGPTFKCPFCEEYFCEYHKKPREPTSKLAGEDTHPCFRYQVYMNEQRDKNDIKYKSKLGKIFGKGDIVEVKDEYPEETFESTNEEEAINSKNLSSADLRKLTMKNLNSKFGSDENEEDLRKVTLNSLKKERLPVDYDEDVEMYNPHSRGFSFNFNNPFRNIFSFRLSHEIKETLVQFSIALFIGLILNYVYYQNISLHYLFIGGVQEWFGILMAVLNYGIGGGYDLVYLIINGIFYFYLFSTVVKLFYATITNLDRKSTWWFLASIAILVFAIFKYFPNIIY